METTSYWNLREAPFENVRKPSFYFQGQEHHEALARFRYMLDDRNMLLGLLTGEIGSGKTFLCEMLRNLCHERKYVVAYLENTDYPFEDLLREIIFQARPSLRTPRAMQAQPTRYQLLQGLKRNIIDPLAQNDGHMVIVLDEVQEIDNKRLGEIKMLTNINPPDKNVLTTLLVGQPELRGLIKKVPYIDQRVGLRFHLNTLNAVEIGPYIRHRLMKAGHPTGALFNEDAVAVINRMTQGVPREINRVCKLVLDRACYLNLREISERVVVSVFNDFAIQNGVA